MSDKIIVALDGIEKQRALQLAEQLQGLCWGFKVNDLLLECGISILRELKPYGRVFADPKLHDIPNTVSNGVKRLAAEGADLITVHASGGRAMLEAAENASGNSTILAVTALTSLETADTQFLFSRSPEQAVEDFAVLAAEANVGGLVCSPKELKLVSKRQELKPLLKVIPGIRPAASESDDQKRTLTPKETMELGAGLLVIGRPITKAADPKAALTAISASIKA